MSDDGTSVDYKLMASNINNAFMAHIHCGVPGIERADRRVAVSEHRPGAGSPPGSGPHDGVLAEGTFTNANVIPRPDAATACPGGVSSLADVLAKIEAHGTYVNVHTNDGAPPNEGPGDFPGGEVRGQLDKSAT